MKTEYSIPKYIKRMFYAIAAMMFIGLFIAQICYPSEREQGHESEQLRYQGTLFWEKEDGSKEQITAPGTYAVEPGETMVITTVLPENFAANSIMIRSSQQNVRIYVEGILRCEYDTKATRPFGKNSTSRYIFCQTSEEDAGKELRIELLSYAGRYSGVINEILCGDKADIWSYLFEVHGASSLIAFFLMFAGIVTIMFSIALGIAYKTRISMEYLGWCILLGSFWMLGESKLRQCYVSNASSLASLCFVIVMVCPLPILMYVDSVQHGRYQKFFSILEWVAVGNLFLSSILQFAEIADYLDTMIVSQMILVFTVLAVLVTFYLDFRKGMIRDYLFIVIGLFAALAGVVIECVSVYLLVYVSGLFLGIGMLVLLFCAIINTVKDLRDLENRRQLEQLERRRKQTEAMSLQLIQTLSVTIEAKDDYTKGHSFRVAEYSAMIARALGWDDKEVENIRNAASLHDIGKIGIPDVILNKPSRLLDEEYEIIKQHTTIGADILKNISLVPHAEEVARYHHERYDGKGYPGGISGEAIPMYARIVAVADSYDAMSSKRIYRNALARDVIRKEIIENRGRQFDPVIADTFIRLLDTGKVRVTEKEQSLFTEENLSEPEMSGTTEACRFISEVVDTMNSQKEVQNIDFLTGLPMRNFGEKQIAERMQTHPGCLVFFDLDNLKKINDIHGHKAGDRVLKILGDTISECVKEAIACRLGGDEFLLFLQDTEKETAEELVKKIFESFLFKKEQETELREASLSGGLCMSKKGDSFTDCYAKADKALYYIKQNGKDGYSFYHQMEQGGGKLRTAERDLDKIAKALQESGSYVGALDLDNREFSKIYEYVSNLGERYNHSCHLVMITMDAVSDNTMYIEDIEQALQCMETAIRSNIRNVDVCTRYSSMQYLLILLEAGTDKIPFIMERIFTRYYKLYSENDFIPHYEFKEMLDNASE